MHVSSDCVRWGHSRKRKICLVQKVSNPPIQQQPDVSRRGCRGECTRGNCVKESGSATREEVFDTNVCNKQAACIVGREHWLDCPKFRMSQQPEKAHSTYIAHSHDECKTKEDFRNSAKFLCLFRKELLKSLWKQVFSSEQETPMILSCSGPSPEESPFCNN